MNLHPCGYRKALIRYRHLDQRSKLRLRSRCNANCTKLRDWLRVKLERKPEIERKPKSVTELQQKPLKHRLKLKPVPRLRWPMLGLWQRKLMHRPTLTQIAKRKRQRKRNPAHLLPMRMINRSRSRIARIRKVASTTRRSASATSATVPRPAATRVDAGKRSAMRKSLTVSIASVGVCLAKGTVRSRRFRKNPTARRGSP